MDASLRKGLFSILLLHICVSQVLVTSETPLAPESIPPLTEVTAQEAEVKELTLSAPAVEQENEVQNVVQDAVEAVKQAIEEEAAEEEAAEEVAEEAAAPEPVAETLEPAEQEAEAAGEVGQEVALEVAEEAAAVEELAPEEEVVVEEVAQPVGEEAEVAEAEPAQEEAVPEPVGQGEPAVVEAAEEVVEEVREEAAVGEAVEEGTEPVVETAEEVLVDSNETGASQASETGEPDLTPGPADTYVPAESQGPAIPSSREETNHVGGENVQESNDFNEIITSKDELLNPVPAEEAPTLDNVVVVVEDVEAEEEEEKEEQVVEEEEVIPATASAPLLEEEMVEEGESVEATADEGAALGLEAWKIGAISAAVFLFLETIVIIVYFLKCRKKTVSGAVPVKATEDCEAAKTTAEEASESSPASEDQTQQNNIAESLDMSQFQQEETMADIPLDPPAESSPEEPTDGVRTSVL